MRRQPTGHIVTCMLLAAACNDPNIRTAPTAKLIATAKTNAWVCESNGVLSNLGAGPGFACRIESG
jgi:hypothetical protein